MAIEILRTQLTHNWSLFGPNGGSDSFVITVPPQHSLLDVQLNILNSKGKTTVTIAQSPNPGFNGTGTIRVRWAVNSWLSQLSYEIVVLANPVCAFQPIGVIRDKWLQLGAESGTLGCALINETPTRDLDHDGINRGRFNDFVGGSIYWHPKTTFWRSKQLKEAYMITGLIRDRWKALNAELGHLGYPVTDETSTPDGIGKYNHFEHGSIYWTPATGAVEVYGAIRERWAELRWERGFLGYPVSPPQSNGTFNIARFQGGEIKMNVSTEETHVTKFPSPTSPNYSIPIRGFRVADSNGGRPCDITAPQVRQWVNEANEIYAAAGIVFSYDDQLPNLLDDDINNLPAGNAEGYSKWVSARDKLNQLAATHRAIIMAYRHGPGTTRVGGGFSSPDYHFVAMAYFDGDALSILAHELGHQLGLGHTHGRDFKTIREATDFILSGGSIEALDNDTVDNIHDTPADPLIWEIDDLVRNMFHDNNCDNRQIIQPGSKSVNAAALASAHLKLARKNIMSYWYRFTGSGRTEWGQLTHDQIDRVRKIISERQKHPHLDVTETF